MSFARTALAAFMLLATLHGSALAIIRTEVVILVGVELDADHGKAAAKRTAELDAHGLTLLVTPSIVVGDQPPKYRYYVGRVLGRVAADRTGDEAATLPMPDPTDARDRLVAAGFAAHIERIALHAIVQRDGGR